MWNAGWGAARAPRRGPVTYRSPSRSHPRPVARTIAGTGTDSAAAGGGGGRDPVRAGAPLRGRSGAPLRGADQSRPPGAGRRAGRPAGHLGASGAGVPHPGRAARRDPPGLRPLLPRRRAGGRPGGADRPGVGRGDGPGGGAWLDRPLRLLRAPPRPAPGGPPGCPGGRHRSAAGRHPHRPLGARGFARAGPERAPALAGGVRPPGARVPLRRPGGGPGHHARAPGRPPVRRRRRQPGHQRPPGRAQRESGARPPGPRHPDSAAGPAGAAGLPGPQRRLRADRGRPALAAAVRHPAHQPGLRRRVR